jgi:uncharacterized protein YycO
MKRALLIVLCLLVNGCAGTQGLKRRMGPEHAAETRSWLRALKTKGGPGMWIISRGYHGGDDLVAVTTNSPLSHASVLDPEGGRVIEAIGSGVQENGLSRFLEESHRVVLVRPEGWTPASGRQALDRAVEQIGKGYDFLGIIGVPSKKRWYCSELACWSMGLEVDRLGAHRVIHPRKLVKLGTVLFDSGQRDAQPDGLDEPAGS